MLVEPAHRGWFRPGQPLVHRPAQLHNYALYCMTMFTEQLGFYVFSLISSPTALNCSSKSQESQSELSCKRTYTEFDIRFETKLIS